MLRLILGIALIIAGIIMAVMLVRQLLKRYAQSQSDSEASRGHGFVAPPPSHSSTPPPPPPPPIPTPPIHKKNLEDLEAEIATLRSSIDDIKKSLGSQENYLTNEIKGTGYTQQTKTNEIIALVNALTRVTNNHASMIKAQREALDSLETKTSFETPTKKEVSRINRRIDEISERMQVDADATQKDIKKNLRGILEELEWRGVNLRYRVPR